MAGPSPFRAIFPPSSARHIQPAAFLTFLIKDHFTLPTLLTIGALLQSLLLLLLPTRWAILPSISLGLYSILTTTLQTLFPRLNPYPRDIIPGRTSAQLPSPSYSPSSPSSPLFGPHPSSQPIVIFHLGFRHSSPLGLLSPQARELSSRALPMFDILSTSATRYHCLGSSVWRGSGRERNNTMMSVFYFASMEGLMAFAHDKVHREAWAWWDRWRKDNGDAAGQVGLFHEMFKAEAGSWESLYVDMPPTLLGAAEVRVRNEETGEDEWVVPLVDADHKALRGSYGRIGRREKGVDG